MVAVVVDLPGLCYLAHVARREACSLRVPQRGVFPGVDLCIPTDPAQPLIRAGEEGDGLLLLRLLCV